MKYTISLTKKKFILVNIVIFILLMASVFFVKYRAWNEEVPLSCAMRIMFKLYCPGCGGTRAAYMLLHGRVLESIMYHPVVLYGAFFLTKYYIKLWASFIRNRQKAECEMNVMVIWVLLIIVVTFFVGRNILLVTGTYDYIGDLYMYY